MWLWTQLSGPRDITLRGVHSPWLQVDKLHVDATVGSPTLYQFQLTVWDYLNLTNTSTVSITYRKGELSWWYGEDILLFNAQTQRSPLMSMLVEM